MLFIEHVNIKQELEDDCNTMQDDENIPLPIFEIKAEIEETQNEGVLDQVFDPLSSENLASFDENIHIVEDVLGIPNDFDMYGKFDILELPSDYFISKEFLPEISPSQVDSLVNESGPPLDISEYLTTTCDFINAKEYEPVCTPLQPLNECVTDGSMPNPDNSDFLSSCNFINAKDNLLEDPFLNSDNMVECLQNSDSHPSCDVEDRCSSGDTMVDNTQDCLRNHSMETIDDAATAAKVPDDSLSPSLINTDKVAKVVLRRVVETNQGFNVEDTTPSKDLELQPIFNKELRVKLPRLEDLDLRTLLMEQNFVTGLSSHSTVNQVAEEKLNKLVSSLKASLMDLKKKKKRVRKKRRYYGFDVKTKILRSTCNLCKKVFDKRKLMQHQEKCKRVIGMKCKICKFQYKSKERFEEHQESMCDTVKTFGCDVCFAKFIFKRSLVEHQNPVCKSLREPVFSCSVCKKTFQSKSMHKTHMIEHGVGIMLCHICGVIRSNHSFKEHLLLHSDDKQYVCNNCGISFKSKRARETHHKNTHADYKNTHAEKVLKCAECNKGFSSKHMLEIHIRIHTGEKPFSCKECGKLFRTSTLLCKHRKSHKGDPYSCSYCGISFRKSRSLRDHERIHTGEKQYDCQECGKLYRTSHGLSEHRKSHKDAHLYSCSYCEKSFHKSRSLRDHERIHTGEKPFSCKECGKLFRTSTLLCEHRKSHIDGNPYSCSYCGISFRKSRSLRDHERIHTGEKPYDCQECGKLYRTSHGLSQHRNSHKDARLYSCSYCEKSFRKSRSLRDHERIHTGEKQYRCKDCGKLYLTYHELRDHRKSHKDLYSCSYCERSFFSADTLKVHIRLHTGEKPYCCEECGRLFTSTTGLRIHTLRHKSTQPFSCSYCNMSFCYQYELNKHISKHTTTNSFTCNECNKSFRTIHQLNIHSLVHYASAPFSCGFCEESFTNPLIFEQHVFEHVSYSSDESKTCAEYLSATDRLEIPSNSLKEEKPYTCTKCEMAFNVQYDLNMHIIGTHMLKDKLPSKVEHETVLKEKNKKTEMELSNIGEKSFKKCEPKHELNQRFPCLQCGLSYRRSRSLKTHMRIHTGEKPYACAICNTFFRTREEINRHNYIHFGNPNSCGICKKSFSKRCRLTKHLLSHSKVETEDSKEDIKNILSENYQMNVDLLADLQLLPDEKPYICAKCKIAFISFDELNSHIIEVHKVKPSLSSKLSDKPIQLIAPLIKSFTDEDSVSIEKNEFQRETKDQEMESRDTGNAIDSDVTYHDSLKRKYLDSNDDNYFCKECSKSFPSVDQLNEHIVSHENMPHTCRYCEKSFECTSSLSKHILSHIFPNLTGSGRGQHFMAEPEPEHKPFVCSTCNKICNSLDHLEEHSQKHTQNLKCPKCDKTFKKNYNLQCHLRMHDHNKVHYCTSCDKSFTTAFSLNRHRRGLSCKENQILREPNTSLNKLPIPSEVEGEEPQLPTMINSQTSHHLNEHLSCNLIRTVSENPSENVISTKGAPEHQYKPLESSDCSMPEILDLSSLGVLGPILMYDRMEKVVKLEDW